MEDKVKKFRTWFNTRTGVAQVIFVVLFSPVLVSGYVAYLVIWMYILMPLELMRSVLSGRPDR